MFLFRWFRRAGQTDSLTPPARELRSRQAGAAFRPGVELLDDRLAPSAASLFGAYNPSGPATHFSVTTPEAGTAGASSPVAVVALDASNHVVQNYTGTVQLTASDGTIPATYTFTAADHGIHLFTETLGTPGTDTVTATDSTAASITGSASLTVNPAPVATHLAVVVQPQAYAGAPTQVAVVALDAANHIVPTYTGTVRLTSSGTADTLPAAYTFTASDHGVHVFTVTAGTAGSDTLTATDTNTSTVTGSATVTVNAAPVATHFAVVVQPQAYAGAPTQVAVVALDAANHIVPTYTGTVSLTSTDAGATLPASYTFTAADHGVHTLNATFDTAGSYTVTATDGANAALTGTAAVTVNPAQVVTHFALLARPQAYAGAPTQVMVVALDASNHVVQNYTGTVQLTSSDGGATLPAAYTFTAADRGIHVFAVTLSAAGSQTITAADTTNSSLTATAAVNVSSSRPGRGGYHGWL
ncbi:MAG: Ribose transport system, periplasmic ribose-binding protein RbsB [Gemmataceae bacterium]|nr:Ribose transport system, periplasmic ribose-binding protein RbsB [Gemmataceae bacterium]